MAVRWESAGAVELITHELTQFTVTSECHFLQGGDVFCRAHKSCATVGIPIGIQHKFTDVSEENYCLFCLK